MDICSGFATLVAQIPLVDKFRWIGWFYVFYATMQMLITSVLFKEKWTDLKRTSIQCRRLSILSGIAVPLYVSSVCVCVCITLKVISLGTSITVPAEVVSLVQLFGSRTLLLSSDRLLKVKGSGHVHVYLYKCVRVCIFQSCCNCNFN